MPRSITNAMTVDVEDYFQVLAFENIIDRSQWGHLPCRVERNTDRILELFTYHGTKATFFVLGWVAERYPQLVRRIVDAGHELGSHGYTHTRATEQKPLEFRNDVVQSKQLLENISGIQVQGYRAASYSINESNPWAFDELEEAGYTYSSSVYPIKHDFYGMPSAPRFPYYPIKKEGILEIPITTVYLFKKTWPCGGGGFFRLYPYVLSRWALRHVNVKDQQPSIFYFHPWEIDVNQPRQKGISLKARVRHYLNLSRMEHRLHALLVDFSWDRMDNIFLQKKQ